MILCINFKEVETDGLVNLLSGADATSLLYASKIWSGHVTPLAC